MCLNVNRSCVGMVTVNARFRCDQGRPDLDRGLIGTKLK
jgi:hypothetical protein